jgi:hypothetical protein
MEVCHLKRTILLALSGLGYFIISLLLMTPLRTKPVPNYLPVLFIVLTALLLFLFYKLCREQDEKKAYIFGFFSAIVLWQVIGELASIRVPAGIITQISALNIKELDSAIYLIFGWLMLAIIWKTKAVGERFCFFSTVFLGIWTFELYMENYSAYIPLKTMGLIANILLILSALSILWVLFASRRTTSELKQLFNGGILYLLLSILLMSAGSWRTPQVFYQKYEKANIEHQIKDL